MIENLVTHPKTDLLPYGTIQTFEMEMKPYPDHRRRMIRVWLPDDYDGVKRFPVVYMHDGQGLFRSDDGRAKLEPDRAITKLKEEIGFSAIVVGIDNSPMRGTELTPPYTRRTRQDPVGGHPVPVIPGESTTATYAKFVVEHLKPLIDENYMTLPDAVNTCVGGISAGGSASYYMFLQYPEVFGKAIVCSPGGVKLTFSDDGAAYDPLMHADPDVSLPAEERPIGGLGILMVKKMATDILYRREGGRNVLAVALASPRRDMI